MLGRALRTPRGPLVTGDCAWALVLMGGPMTSSLGQSCSVGAPVLVDSDYRSVIN